MARCVKLLHSNRPPIKATVLSPPSFLHCAADAEALSVCAGLVIAHCLLTWGTFFPPPRVSMDKHCPICQLPTTNAWILCRANANILEGGKCFRWNKSPSQIKIWDSQCQWWSINSGHSGEGLGALFPS